MSSTKFQSKAKLSIPSLQDPSSDCLWVLDRNGAPCSRIDSNGFPGGNLYQAILTAVAQGGGGGGSPAGATTAIQFNNAGAFDGVATDGISTPGASIYPDGEIDLFAAPGAFLTLAGGATASAGLQVDDSATPTKLLITNLEADGQLSIEADGPLLLESSGNNADSGILIVANGPTGTGGLSIGDTQNAGGAGVGISSSSNAVEISAGGPGSGGVVISGDAVTISPGPTGLSFFGVPGAQPPTITGVAATEPIAAQIVAALAAYGLVVNGLT